jgi:hypothetical protein
VCQTKSGAAAADRAVEARMDVMGTHLPSSSSRGDQVSFDVQDVSLTTLCIRSNFRSVWSARIGA